MNYAGADIAMIGAYTLNQCKLRCWLNPSCGLIVVDTPCSTMNLTSTDPDTVVCSQCWLKLTSGWSIVADTASSSFMLYDRVYPPTQTGVKSVSTTASPRATATVVTGGTYDICALNGGSVSLPLIGSSVTIKTNTAAQYTNNLNCAFTVRGATVGSTLFVVTPISVSTEAGYDRLYVRDSVGNTAVAWEGAAGNGITVSSSSFLSLQFISDGSNVGNGVVFTITLGVPTATASTSVSRSPSRSALATGSPSVSGSNSVTARMSVSPSVSGSNSGSAWASSSGRSTALASGSSGGGSASSRVTLVASGSGGVGGSYSLRLTASGSPSPLVSRSPSVSSSGSPSPLVSRSPSVSSSGSGSASSSPSTLVSSSSTGSVSVSPTVSRSGFGSSSGSALPSESAPLGTASLVGTSTVWPSASSSSTNSALVSHSVCQSATVGFSPSAGSTHSLCSTRTPSWSVSETQSMSPSTLVTPSTTPSPIVRRIAGPPPALPKNLSSLSLGEIGGLFTTFALYEPALIQNDLQRLGMAGLAAGGGKPLSISTDAFDMQIAPVAAGAAALDAGSIKVGLPPMKAVFPSAAGAALINWAAAPYADPTQAAPDSPTISLSLLNSGGESISVSNLTTPITLSMSLNLAADDWRLQKPPVYFVRCDIGQILVQTGAVYSVFDGAAHYPGGVVSVPCIKNVWYNATCSAGAFLNITCPAPIITQRCLYWDTNLSTWSSDGCVAAAGAGATAGTMTCQCTHLTDFSARVDAVVDDNKAVFANAATVYSIDGLRKYAEWYAIFGSLGLATLMLGCMVCRIDYISTVKYVRAISDNTYMTDILKLAPNVPIYVYDDMSTMREIDKIKEKQTRKRAGAMVVRSAEAPKITLWQRILQQHNRVSFFFRFDPRLNRIFRLLALSVIQFHSLFVTALLFGFTYYGGPLAWYDIIILSLITTSLNLPVFRLMITSINSIGAIEFKFLYPVLYAEYHRRVEFERIAMVYLANKRATASAASAAAASANTLILTDAAADDTTNRENDELVELYADDAGDGDSSDFTEIIVEYLFMYLLCCFHRGKVEHEDLSELSQRTLLKRMAHNIRESYPYIEAYQSNWGWLPCQTWQGATFIVASFGWLAWCLNYLLLFASAHSREIGTHVLTSYAVSEITTIFVSQPLIILITVAVYWLANRFKAYIPEWIRRLMLVHSVGRIPSLFYFSDPWVKATKTAFTSEFAYNIFVKCPAAVSGANELAYAPMKAAATTIGDDDGTASAAAAAAACRESEEISNLYMRMVGVWKEIQDNGR